MSMTRLVASEPQSIVPKEYYYSSLLCLTGVILTPCHWPKQLTVD